MSKNVVIVGAGPAGLTTAYYLLKNTNEKLNVILLEKEAMVGGISKTIDMDGYKIDTGIHRFFTKSDEVEKIWNELLPVQNKPAYDELLIDKQREYSKEGSNPENEDKSFLIKDRVTRIYYGKKFYDYPVAINYNTIKNLGFINIIKVGFSYIKSCLIKLPEDSLENFYINRFGKTLYNMFFKSYTEKVWGLAPKNISADWGAQRVKGLSVGKAILEFFHKPQDSKKGETSLISSFKYPKLGTGQMYEEMKNEIEKMGGKILFNSSIDEFICENNKIKKIKYHNKNKEKTLNVDILVSSMPIKDLFMQFSGIDIPKNIFDIATNLPYRNFMAVGFLVDDFKLKNKTKIKTLMDVIPDSWIYIHEPSLKVGRLQIFNNWSPYLFKNKEECKDKVMCTLEYFSSDNDVYWNMSDKDFIEFATKEAIELGLFDRKNILKTIRIKIDKAYPAYFGTYKDFDKVKDFLNNIDNLYCIGRNGQHRYNNMDHSILTGIEAAKSIMNNSRNKDIIWKVNTEKDYHEEK